MAQECWKSCQSCGMPLKNFANSGTELDGNKSPKYCHFCYENGKFIGDENISLEDFKKQSIEAMVKKGFPRFVAKFFTGGLDKLQRWNKD